MNVGLSIQIIGIVAISIGLVFSHQQHKPTMFSYVSRFIESFKQDDYFQEDNSGLIYNGATKQVTNGLLEVGRTLKVGNITGAERVLEGIPKTNLTPTDLTNIQSTRAAIELKKGNFGEAETIYRSIVETGTDSNAVFSGLATIAAFKTQNLYETNHPAAIALLNESNTWYLKALAGDHRPQVTVHIYFGLYDNYKRLTKYFKQDEGENLENYRNLFLEANEKVGNPYPTK